MSDADSTADEARAPASDNLNVDFEVLLPGQGLIFTGEFDAKLNRFATYRKGDRGRAHPSIANRLRERGLVKILA